MIISDDARMNSSCFVSRAVRYGVPLTFYEPEKEMPVHVAQIGNREAGHAVVITSGVHGLELPFGSYMQWTWLPAAIEICSRKKDISFVFVHALNPFGAEHGLRGDRNNIDVNRNFVDFSSDPPTPEGYPQLAEAIYPKSPDDFSYTASMVRILRYGVLHRREGIMHNLVAGQYTDARGLYYGGKAPCPSREIWDQIVREHIHSAPLQKLWHIDLHTGEGRYGELSVMVNEADKQNGFYRRISHIEPKPVISANAFTKITGDITDYWPRVLPQGVEVAALTLEAGTSKLGGLDVLQAMIARNHLWTCHRDDHPKGDAIVRQARDLFNPKDLAWRQHVERQADRFWRTFMPFVLASH